MTVTINGSNGLTFNDNSTQTTAATGFGFKNRIINGDMRIDQRNAGAAITLDNTGWKFPVDRFGAYEDTDGVMTAQQISDAPAGFINSIRFTTTTADASLGATQRVNVRQCIEGYNTADLAFGTAGASTITVSFWVKSSLTGTFGAVLINNNGTRTYPFSYTINSANTWEQKTITVSGDQSGTWLTTNGIGLQIMFSLGVGSTYRGTAGAWVGSELYSVTGEVPVIGTLNATWQITGVQLEKGSTATSFDYRPYSTELQLAQRYYYRLSIANQSMFSNGQCASTTICFGLVQFPVPMRTAPTALEQSGTASHYTVYHSGTNTDCSVVPTYTTATTADNALVNFTVASGLTVGRAANQRSNNNAAYLGWSAEL